MTQTVLPSVFFARRQVPFIVLSVAPYAVVGGAAAVPLAVDKRIWIQSAKTSDTGTKRVKESIALLARRQKLGFK